MPTLKETSDAVREAFGMGTKSYENASRGRPKPRQDRRVNVIAVVSSDNEISKVMKSVAAQTYRNVSVTLVSEDESLFGDGEPFVKGSGFYDAVVHFMGIPEAKGQFFTEFRTDNFWAPGHLESLIDVADDGVPVASKSVLHETSGWDGIAPADNEFAHSECILWGWDDLKAWEDDDEFRSVDRLLESRKEARTNRPTVILKA